MKMCSGNIFAIFLNFFVLLRNIECLEVEVEAKNQNKNAPLRFASLWEKSQFNHFSGSMNKTLVAAQNIYDDNGNLKEIKTLELQFPQSAKSSKTNPIIFNDSPKEEDEDVLRYYSKKLEKSLSNYEALSSIEMPMQISYEQYNDEENGKVESYVFLAQNFFAGYRNGVGFINETIEVNDSKIVREYVLGLTSEEHAIPIVQLTKNVDGKPDKERSFFVDADWTYGEQIITITQMEVDDNRILSAAAAAFRKAVYESPETVKADLVVDMKSKFPNYFWFVVTDGSSRSLDLDKYVLITMKKDCFKLFAEEGQSLTLIGIKTDTAS